MTQTYGVTGIWLAWWAAWLFIGMGARKNVSREQFSHRIPHLAALIAGIALVFSPLAIPAYFPLGWPENARWLAMLGIISGLAFASWARLHLGRNWSGLVAIKDGHELVTTGPYRLVRHPIYTGLTFAFVMTALCVNTWGSVLGVSFVTLAFVIKSAHEERYLRRVFGNSYAQLCDSVPARLVPWCF